MDYFSRNKILGWVIAIGLVINIAAITTILIKVYSEKGKTECNGSIHKNPHDFIRKELNLSKEQEIKFKQIKDASKTEAKLIFEQMRNQRTALLSELAQKNPDSIKVKNYISEIETSQSKLLHHTVKHYLELKKVLREDQYQNLNLLFMNMFGCEKNKSGKCGKDDGEGGKRYRHGQQKESCNKDF